MNQLSVFHGLPGFSTKKTPEPVSTNKFAGSTRVVPPREELEAQAAPPPAPAPEAAPPPAAPAAPEPEVSQTQTLFDQIMKRHDQNAADTMSLLQRQNAFNQNAATGQAGRMSGGVGAAFLAGTGQAQLNAQDKLKEAQISYNQQRNDITTAQIDNTLANERLDKQTQAAERAQVFNAISSLMGEQGDPELAAVLMQSMGGEYGGLSFDDLGASMAGPAAGAEGEAGGEAGAPSSAPVEPGPSLNGKLWTTEPPVQWQGWQTNWQTNRNNIHYWDEQRDILKEELKFLNRRGQGLTSRAQELRSQVEQIGKALDGMQELEKEMLTEAKLQGHDPFKYKGDGLY